MSPNRIIAIFRLLLLLPLLLAAGSVRAADVSIAQSAPEIDVWDFLEVTLNVKGAKAKNPFTDVLVTGSCQREMQVGTMAHGYCDSQDGSVFKIRFMPSEPGSYNFNITYQEGADARTFNGTFQVRPSGRKGPVQARRGSAYHFKWTGTNEPFFWNGTTAYWLLGWEDEEVIRKSLDRLAKHKVNVVRVALNGRTQSGKRWDEPDVVTDEKSRFFFRLDPWVAKNAKSVEDPQFDVQRFNLHHWHKCERMLRHARELNLAVELVFHLDGKDAGVDPFGKDQAGGEDEQLYYKHAVARLASFSNVIWCLTNEWALFRDEAWVNTMGDWVKKCDPYDRLTTVHGHYDFKFRTASWCDFASYQSWDEKGGYAYMLENRDDQAAAGRGMPQVNEEYGYEDHYPTGWGDARKPPSRNADSRRRLAWEIYMAGSYQTSGERANQGTGAGKNTGGGWINGRGDAEMKMLEGYAHIVDFFATFQWWLTNPVANGVESGNAYLLAEPGRQYAAWLPQGGKVVLKVKDGTYQCRLFNCRNGAWRPQEEVSVKEGRWETPEVPSDGDWAVLLQVK